MTTLTQAQLLELRTKLQAQADELMSVLHELEAEVQPVTKEAVPGRLARTAALQEQQLAIAKQQRSRQLLAKIHGALERIEDEEYGCCADCGEDIGFGRLEIQPETLFCVTCREKRD